MPACIPKDIQTYGHKPVFKKHYSTYDIWRTNERAVRERAVYEGCLDDNSTRFYMREMCRELGYLYATDEARVLGNLIYLVHEHIEVSSECTSML